MLAYILHPKYRGEGMKIKTFCKVIEYGIQEIWLKIDLLEEKFYEKVEKHLSEYLAEDDIVEVENDYNYDDDEDEVNNKDKDEDSMNNNSEIDEYLNLASEELRQLFEMQVVEVYIERQPVDYKKRKLEIQAGSKFGALGIVFFAMVALDYA
ncbi:hypothetical protein C1645_823919 [Glomus cerebriforme]|uniref:Uncharacterized protein n=1 Tax=Glomus cerebriforme TaxID=658196 RepID=A0A397SVK4_9GLOM|nr:hypothetical protein C1645_823919 [Glomus cerebriforme]